MTEHGKKNNPKLSELVNFNKVDEKSDFLPSGGEIDELFTKRGKPHLFLGYYTKEMIEEKLASYGVKDKIAQKGFRDILIHLDVADTDRQRVIICFDRFDYEHLLGELSLTTGEFTPSEPYYAKLGSRNYKMLFIQWLWLQNPAANFTRERPALPGQFHPGLGVGKLVAKMFEGIAERLQLDGIINIPEYVHNSMLYAKRFNFLNPRRRGSFWH